MTELQIYKFINDNKLECRWQVFYDSKEPVKKLNVWIPPYLLKEFCDMLGYSAFDDGGYADVELCYDGTIFVENLDEILEMFDIEPTSILPMSDED